MNATSNKLPYNKLNPVIYDNDSHSDMFTDELLMALASTGEINLKGIITTSPENVCVNIETYELDVAGREEIANKARRSGMKNIPDPVRGPSKPLTRPDSNRIEDTLPINTPGSRLIVEEAMKASPERPLVVFMGGPLTVVADAYLLNNRVADKIVVSWLGGTITDTNDYNGVMDKWASYIVVQRLKLIQFPVGIGAPKVPKDKLVELPDCELRQYMIEKRLPHVNQLPEGLFEDGDAQPVISMLNENYILEYKTVSFDRWGDSSQGTVIKYKEDRNGNIMLVTHSSGEIATEEWWKALKNPSVWDRNVRSVIKKQRPFYAPAFPIGRIHRIEAEDFDHGGEGIAYHSKLQKNFPKIYRHANVKIVMAKDVFGGYNMGLQGGYCVADLSEGDWLKHTINVDEEDFYDITVRVASKVKGGSFHIEFDNEDKTGKYEIPPTGGEFVWDTISKNGIYLKKGIQVMKILVESVGENEVFGKINYIQFTKSKMDE